jgi:hypothetical protein
LGSKLNPGEFDCYANLEPDEPYFVLMGRDRQSSRLVRDWADRRAAEINKGLRPKEEMTQVYEAYQVANWMEDFYRMRLSTKKPPVKQAG